jgi:hypothetical protein
MKRPIELTIALIVLCAEYFALLPMYFSIGGVPLIGFLIFRPPVLYLLWRGTSWVRTLFIWSIPIVSVVGFVRAWTKYTGAAVGGQTDAPVGPQDVWENLYNAVQASSFSMWVGAVGFFAWLVLYLPRVRAWFQYMKESRKKPPDKNSWLQPINASPIRELGKAFRRSKAPTTSSHSRRSVDRLPYCGRSQGTASGLRIKPFDATHWLNRCAGGVEMGTSERTLAACGKLATMIAIQRGGSVA